MTFSLTDPSRTVGKGNYHHTVCAGCSHSFAGSKRDIYCAHCQEDIVHEDTKKLYEKEINS